VSIVIDASVAASWIFQAQATDATERLKASSDRFIAPHLFLYEVRNVIAVQRRRDRLSIGEAEDALSRLGALEISVLPAPDEADCDHIFRLALAEGLNFYDAVYLDLALSDGASIATRDSSLAAAAARRVIQVLDCR
jgi:predicted nucleic acid-binding protein